MNSKPPRPLSWYREVYIKDGYRCVYCGRDMIADFDAWMSLQVDHIIPVSKSGSDSLDNRVTSCNVCNLLKGGFVPEGYEKMDQSELLKAAREHVLKRRALWQSRFVPAMEEFKQAKSVHKS